MRAQFLWGKKRSGHTAAVDMIDETSHMLLSSNAGRPALATEALERRDASQNVYQC